MPWHADSQGRTVPQWLQRQCFERDQNTCQGCGYVGTPGTGDLNCDHVIPIAEGGENTLENVQTLCVPCHKPKIQQEAARGRQRRSGKRRPPMHPADALSKPEPPIAS